MITIIVSIQSVNMQDGRTPLESTAYLNATLYVVHLSYSSISIALSLKKSKEKIVNVKHGYIYVELLRDFAMLFVSVAQLSTGAP